MSTELDTVSKALTDIDAVSAGISALRESYAGVVYEVATTEGLNEAKAARHAIRNPRYEVERIRKAAKVPILALGKKLDAEAARIEGELLKLEAPIDKQIKGEEERKDAERQAKIDAEIKRVADLQERVSELRGNQSLTSMDGSALILEHLNDLHALTVDESFQEFQQQAQDAKAAGVARLQALHTAALTYEGEQIRLKAEREELARLRADQAKRDAEEQRQRIEADRVARIERDRVAAVHAEELRQQRQQQEADARAERERIAEEERQSRARQKAEDDRIAADRAELQRQQDAQRKAQEPQKPAPTRRGVAIKVPSAAEMIDVLAKHYKAHPDTIIDWLTSTDFSAVKAA